MPDGRTGLYMIYRCCERFNLSPPITIPKEYRSVISWDDLNVYEQANMLAYEQIRELEEAKELEYIALSGMKKIGL